MAKNNEGASGPPIAPLPPITPTDTPKGETPLGAQAGDSSTQPADPPTPQVKPTPEVKTADASMAHVIKAPSSPMHFVGMRNFAGATKTSAFYKDAEGDTHEVVFTDGIAKVEEHELEHFADESRFIIRSHE